MLTEITEFGSFYEIIIDCYESLYFWQKMSIIVTTFSIEFQHVHTRMKFELDSMEKCGFDYDEFKSHESYVKAFTFILSIYTTFFFQNIELK